MRWYQGLTIWAFFYLEQSIYIFISNYAIIYPLNSMLNAENFGLCDYVGFSLIRSQMQIKAMAANVKL